MKLSVQPDQASHGAFFVIVDEDGDILLSTWDATPPSHDLARKAAASPDLLGTLKGLVDAIDFEGPTGRVQFNPGTVHEWPQLAAARCAIAAAEGSAGHVKGDPKDG